MSALDFKALLEEEKRKVLGRLRQEKAGDEASTRKEASVKLESSAFVEEFEPFRLDAPSRVRELKEQEHLVGKLQRVYYCREFVTKEEEERLMCSANEATNAWVKLKVRRLQLWGRNPNDGPVAARGGVPRPRFPPFVKEVTRLLSLAGVFPQGEGDGGLHSTNSCLLNSYVPGEGILPHTDGPRYEAKTATLSLGSSAVLSFWDKERKHEMSLLLEVR